MNKQVSNLRPSASRRARWVCLGELVEDVIVFMDKCDDRTGFEDGANKSLHRLRTEIKLIGMSWLREESDDILNDMREERVEVLESLRGEGRPVVLRALLGELSEIDGLISAQLAGE